MQVLQDWQSQQQNEWVAFATDVRMSSKEQVESLGGKFLTVEGAENLETSGGYAKETQMNLRKNKKIFFLKR